MLRNYIKLWGENWGKIGEGAIGLAPKSKHLVLGPHPIPLKNSSKSVQNFLSNLAVKQTD